jgi:hypothetical protein
MPFNRDTGWKCWLQGRKEVEESLEKPKQAVKELIEVYFRFCLLFLLLLLMSAIFFVLFLLYGVSTKITFNVKFLDIIIQSYCTLCSIILEYYLKCDLYLHWKSTSHRLGLSCGRLPI